MGKMMRNDAILSQTGSWQRPVADFCEYGNECSGTVTDEEFLHKVSNYQILKTDPGPRS